MSVQVYHAEKKERIFWGKKVKLLKSTNILQFFQYLPDD